MAAILEQEATTVQRIFDRAAAGRSPVLAFHFPFPGLGRVVSKGEVRQPLDTLDLGSDWCAVGA